MHLGRRRRVKRSAIDSTGLECSAASGYFIRRRTRVAEPWKTVVYHHFPKLAVVCDTDSHFILAACAGRGPRPDVDEFCPLFAEAMAPFDCCKSLPTQDTTLNPIIVLLATNTACAPSFPPSMAAPRTSH